MATDNKKILTAEQELKLRQPIDDYVGAIQQKIKPCGKTVPIRSLTSRVNLTTSNATASIPHRKRNPFVQS